jgi:hypothetical protein
MTALFQTAFLRRTQKPAMHDIEDTIMRLRRLADHKILKAKTITAVMPLRAFAGWVINYLTFVGVCPLSCFFLPLSEPELLRCSGLFEPVLHEVYFSLLIL